MNKFNDSIEEVSKEVGGSNGGFFTVKEGDNRLRILTEPVHFLSRYNYGICYKDCVYCTKEALEKDKDAKGNPARLTHKYMAWIYDYTDEEIKLYSIPFNVAKQINDFKNDEIDGYGFEEFPMPYGVTLNVKDAGVKTVKYTIKPARENSEISEEILEQLAKETTVEQVIDAMKDKQKKKDEGVAPKEAVDYPEEKINPEDIPF